MSKTNAFVWLSGTVTIPVRAPEEWARDGLGEFYKDPNNPEWGGTLCRVLYHESIHFWQLLSSAYLANALQDEWLRLLELEHSGNLRPASEFVTGMLRQQPGEPFSTHELMECWARYWDVHTRSPATLVEEEGIKVPEQAILRTQQGEIRGYTSEAFDLFMQQGKDAELYAAPYRWMLEQCQGHSAFANIVFPILVFHAFGSPQPVALLQRALELALESRVLWDGIHARSHRINLDWLNSWSAVVGEAVEPARRELQLPDFTAGWDVIHRGPLGSHPVYREYLGRVRTVFQLSAMNQPELKDPTPEGMYTYALAHLPVLDPSVIFAFPGQPEYRALLGQFIPPPRVRFEGLTWHAERQAGAGVMAKLMAQMGQEVKEQDLTFQPVYEELDGRIRRFHHAEYAVSIGLPATAFN